MAMNRRSFLFGAGALAAPAIIRPGILMPVSVWREPGYSVRFGIVHDFVAPNSRTIFAMRDLGSFLQNAEWDLERPLAEHEREHLSWFYNSGRDECGWGLPCRTIDRAHLCPLPHPVDAQEETCA
jgi:hypothetical protein